MFPISTLAILAVGGGGVLLVGVLAVELKVSMLTWCAHWLVSAGAVALVVAAGGFGVNLLTVQADTSAQTMHDIDQRQRQYAAYHDAVASRLESTTGLRPLAVDSGKLPFKDDMTSMVRMESQDALLTCLLNTRTGPSSVTSHCAPYTPSPGPSTDLR